MKERLWVYNSREIRPVISFDPTNSTVGRVGARLTHTWRFTSSCRYHYVTAWLSGNFWCEYQGDSHTIFASNTGGVRFLSDLTTDWTQTGIGLTAMITPYVSVYGSGNYIHYAHGHGHSSGGEVGVRFNL